MNEVEIFNFVVLFIMRNNNNKMKLKDFPLPNIMSYHHYICLLSTNQTSKPTDIYCSITFFPPH